MFLLDANLLIYAFRRELPQHNQARNWLASRLGSKSVGLPTLAETAFLRLSTKALGPLQAASWPAAWAFLTATLSYPRTTRVCPGPNHPDILDRLARDYQLRGDDVNDGWLAALALELDATLVSGDKGFSRFSELRWLNPLSL